MRRSLLPGAVIALIIFSAAVPPSPGPAAGGQPAFMISAPGRLKGERRGPDRSIAQGIEIECGRLIYIGGLKGRSTTLALRIEHSECTAKALLGLPTDFYQQYACYYVLHDLRAMSETVKWQADVDIKCPDVYTGFGVEMYETEEKFGEATPICATWIPEQADAGTAELRNLAGRRGGIEVRWDLRELDFEVNTPRGVESSLVCGVPSSTSGESGYTGATAVFAHDSKDRPLRLWLSG